MYCYSFGVILLIMTPYHDCGDTDWHLISMKTWVIVFSMISLLQLGKDRLKDYVEKMQRDDQITYRTRSRLLVAMTVFCELVHFCW